MRSVWTVTQPCTWGGSDAHPSAFLDRSSDGGLSWRLVDPPASAAVIAIAIDANQPSVVYVGTAAGLFKSGDRGEHWTALNPGTFSRYPISVVTIAPGDSNLVYAGVQLTVDGNSTIFRTTDGGVTWTVVGPTLRGVSPTPPGVVYVAYSFDGVFKSSDHGDTWSPARTGLGGSPTTDTPVID